MNPINQFLAIVASSIITQQVGVLVVEASERHREYAKASEYAGSVGKPLLVVGGPYGVGFLRSGFLRSPAHGFGDVCMDIDPMACRGAPEAIRGSILDIPYPDKYFGAAFASHVLEHMATVDIAVSAYDELSRVADRVFIATPRRLNVLAQFNPNHHLWVWQGDGSVYFQQRQGHLP